METLHLQSKKKLTEKTQAREIKKILLIDNNKDSALAAALARERYRIVHCDSVQQAWSLVYPHRPHLIILRLSNSNEAALACLQECRVLAEGVPMVVVTPAHVNRAVMKVLQHEAATVLADSLTPQSIRAALDGLEVSLMKDSRGALGTRIMV